MEEEEINEQLQAATQFIIDSKDESVNFRAGGQRFKEGAEAYRAINDKTIQEVSQALQKSPAAVVSQEQLNRIEEIAEKGARSGVANTRCQLPSAENLTEEISKQIISKVIDKLDPAVGKAIERHHAKIDVHHEHQHNHSNMYGRFASCERNRKTMCWLGAITLICLVQFALYLCNMFSIIKLDFGVFTWSFSITIIVAIIGFFVRFFAKE